MTQWPRPPWAGLSPEARVIRLAEALRYMSAIHVSAAAALAVAVARHPAHGSITELGRSADRKRRAVLRLVAALEREALRCTTRSMP